MVEQKKLQERLHRESGNIGTITFMLGGTVPNTDPPFEISNVMCVGFGTHSRGALDISPDWYETFHRTIEKMCGRLPGEVGSKESDGVGTEENANGGKTSSGGKKKSGKKNRRR